LEADLIDAFGLIASQPEIGSKRPDLPARPYRFWFKQRYWIVYQLRGTASPLIVAIIDGRRNVGRLLR
jgi:plasmid stabilization system protein ParE